MLSRRGETTEALERVEEALVTCDSSGESWWLAEIVRTGGVLMRELGRPDEAERRLRRAVELARSQEAKTLELRAATSLAELLREQGRGEEGKQVLGQIYACFNEGADTVDLKAAASLLAASAS